MSDLSTASRSRRDPIADVARRTISGIELVTIPLDHYAELLECRRLVAENNLREKSGGVGVGRIDRDPEVAAFLAGNFEARTLASLYSLCVERFGQGRAPSRSSIQRYRQRRRGPGRPSFRAGYS